MYDDDYTDDDRSMFACPGGDRATLTAQLVAANSKSPAFLSQFGMQSGFGRKA